jgi:hypothetical protein
VTRRGRDLAPADKFRAFNFPAKQAIHGEFAIRLPLRA